MSAFTLCTASYLVRGFYNLSSISSYLWTFYFTLCQRKAFSWACFFCFYIILTDVGIYVQSVVNYKSFTLQTSTASVLHSYNLTNQWYTSHFQNFEFTFSPHQNLSFELVCFFMDNVQWTCGDLKQVIRLYVFVYTRFI